MVIKRYAAKSRATPKPSVFISKWDTTQPGSANDTVVLPLLSPSYGSYDFYVDWGDGNRDNITAYNQSEVTHQYTQTGVYEIKIIGGITGLQFGSTSDRQKIIEISNWGPFAMPNLASVFQTCSNLKLTATDAPSNISYMQYVFSNCTNLGSEGNMNSWDVSNVNNFEYAFNEADTFNQPIGNWNTSNATDFERMFFRATGFNQDIGAWDTSNVINMYSMFDGNGQKHTFNNGGSDSITGWDTSNVTSTYVMFRDCDFNQPIGNWDMSSNTNMGYMFNGSKSQFNQPIGDWNTSKVTNMQNMFENNSVFNQDIGNWDVTGVPSMYRMFYNADNFNNGGSTGINNWRPSSCTNMFQMFFDASGFNQPIGDWDVSNVTSMRQMLWMINIGAPFNQDLSNWDTSSLTDMYGLFLRRDSFNNGGSTGIGAWNTSNVTDMTYVFYGCAAFDQPLDGWNVSNVTTMQYMFYGAHGPLIFNNGGSTGINNWNTSSCTNMQGMFYNCTGFDQPIGDWDVSSVTNMNQMFRKTTSFNQDIGNWDTSSVTNMSSMFLHDVSTKRLFNQDIGNWDVSNVTTFNSFMWAVNGSSDDFNNGGSSSISGWNTSSATDMYGMFLRCWNFNQPIQYWDMSNVTTIYYMLYECDSFNQPIGQWNTSSLTNITAALYGTAIFDQDLSNWVVTGITTANAFMQNANGLSTTNYDRTLSGWSSQAVQNGVNIHFGGSQYSTATGAAFRSALVASGWTITDGGAV